MSRSSTVSKRVLGFVLLGVLAIAAVPAGGQAPLDPLSVPKYVEPMVIPPVMPQAGRIRGKGARTTDYYEIAVREFDQQVLPAGMPMTRVWSYGSVKHPATFNYPAFTIEAKASRAVRVKWINDLVDANDNFLPHLLSVDQTLHWANPPGGAAGRDMHGQDQAPYAGPVPIVTHVHGAHTHQDSDGYPEAWYLPNAANIPAGYATVGSWYDGFKAEFESRLGQAWEAGTAVFQYPNDQRATTLWYHDHTLGMTRANVYAGPAGFYLIRGGDSDKSLGYRAPKAGDSPRARTVYTEIPIVVQDRSFWDDGSLFYPRDRAFFEGLNRFDANAPVVPYLNIPFIPQEACEGISDVPPIWNPEFFGNTMVVNGRTWPYQKVEPRRYRFRYLNGCNSRFLILKHDNDLPFWQIGTEGGFLPAPVSLNELLIAPAERADVIVDFSGLAVGSTIVLQNLGPDDPFGGGVPGVDFPAADPQTTGQVMQFIVVPLTKPDPTTPPDQLVLPTFVGLGPPTVMTPRRITLNEEDSATVLVSEDANESIVLDCEDGEPFGPAAALLGVLDANGLSVHLKWMDAVTEAPVDGSTEVWEIYNFTMDAHPIHIHVVQFQVIDRQGLVMDEEGETVQPVQLVGEPRGPEAWEVGYKDTVIAYPGEVTRLTARFDIPGRFVWHCHILEHEDNEMMRPYDIVTAP